VTGKRDGVYMDSITRLFTQASAVTASGRGQEDILLEKKERD
jgi:hypothetical protein